MYLTGIVLSLMFIAVTLGMFVYGLTADSTNPDTPECGNCSCCKDSKCGDTDMWRYYCTNGCKDGYWGARCYNKCPGNCISCSREYKQDNTCYECKTSYYNSDIQNNCSLTCPAQCTSCYSATICTACNDGYYNTGTITNCSSTCPIHCTACSVATCYSCEAGYYNTNTVKDCSLSISTSQQGSSYTPIIGIVVGAVIGLGIMILQLLILFRLKRRGQPTTSAPEPVCVYDNINRTDIDNENNYSCLKQEERPEETARNIEQTPGYENMVVSNNQS